jgi:phage terminase large subunit
VRGDARVINGQRQARGLLPIQVAAFRASDAVLDPQGQDTPGRLNKDYFANRKAQGWWNTGSLITGEGGDQIGSRKPPCRRPAEG